MITQLAHEMSPKTCHILLHGGLTSYRSPRPFVRSFIPVLDDGTEGDGCGVDFPGIIGEGTTGISCCSTSCVNDHGVPQCGGSNCGGRVGGARSCCVSSVGKHQQSCAENKEAPCWIGERITQNNVPHPVAEELKI